MYGDQSCGDILIPGRISDRWLPVNMHFISQWLNDLKMVASEQFVRHNGGESSFNEVLREVIREDVNSSLNIEVVDSGSVTSLLPFIRIGSGSSFRFADCYVLSLAVSPTCICMLLT